MRKEVESKLDISRKHPVEEFKIAVFVLFLLFLILIAVSVIMVTSKNHLGVSTI
jgi:hypothetical protein